jgi:cell division protein FtsQ
MRMILTRLDDASSEVRWMNRAAAALAVLAVVVWAALIMAWLMHRSAFSWSAIQIEGEVSHNSAATLRANALPRLSGNFFTIDLAAAQRTFEAVPWVRQAVVRRSWPNRLVVSLQEHRAVALWEGPESSDTSNATQRRVSGNDHLVNSYGEIFQANPGDVEEDNLPTLRGPAQSSGPMLEVLRQITPVLKPLSTRVQTLTLSGRGSWRVGLSNGAHIELGRGSNVELTERTQRFVATVKPVIERHQRPLEFADLRHHDGYVVRLRGVSTLSPPETSRN